MLASSSLPVCRQRRAEQMYGHHDDVQVMPWPSQRVIGFAGRCAASLPRTPMTGGSHRSRRQAFGRSVTSARPRGASTPLALHHPAVRRFGPTT